METAIEGAPPLARLRVLHYSTAGELSLEEIYLPTHRLLPPGAPGQLEAWSLARSHQAAVAGVVARGTTALEAGFRFNAAVATGDFAAVAALLHPAAVIRTNVQPGPLAPEAYVAGMQHARRALASFAIAEVRRSATANGFLHQAIVTGVIKASGERFSLANAYLAEVDADGLIISIDEHYAGLQLLAMRSR